MKTVISASRRTDLVAFYPRWLAEAVERGSVEVLGPAAGRGPWTSAGIRPYLRPVVEGFLQSDQGPVRAEARSRAARSALCSLHDDGARGKPGGTGRAPAGEALAQLPGLVSLVGDPQRVSVRFDPILTWREGGARRSNLPFFETVAARAAELGIRDIRFSFAQWYRKAVGPDPRGGDRLCRSAEAEKIEAVAHLAGIAPGI